MNSQGRTARKISTMGRWLKLHLNSPLQPRDRWHHAGPAELVAVALGVLLPLSALRADPAKPLAEAPDLSEFAQAASAEQKLNAIILPEVDFDEAGIEEAVEFLREASREFDPAKTGVSFILRLTKHPKPPTISLDLRQVPLGVAVKAVADLADLRLRVRPWTVTLESFDLGHMLETRLFSDASRAPEMPTH
jgi:hypothetical protein